MSPRTAVAAPGPEPDDNELAEQAQNKLDSHLAKIEAERQAEQDALAHEEAVKAELSRLELQAVQDREAKTESLRNAAVSFKARAEANRIGRLRATTEDAMSGLREECLAAHHETLDADGRYIFDIAKEAENAARTVLGYEVPADLWHREDSTMAEVDLWGSLRLRAQRQTELIGGFRPIVSLWVNHLGAGLQEIQDRTDLGRLIEQYTDIARPPSKDAA